MDPRERIRMNKRKRKGSAERRALKISHKSTRFKVLLALFIALVFFASAFVIYAGTKSYTEEQGKNDFEPEPLEISETDPCDYGMVSVYDGDVLIYQYLGEIYIYNDGTNGKTIDVRIVYPDDTWPCSCNEEMDGKE